MTDTEPKKALGQHWLNDPASLAAIAAEANLSKADTVLEIGPGQGSLTRLLVESAGQVVAVELDKELASNLSKQKLASNLTVVNQDILKFDLRSLASGYKVVANIPYYLSSNLIRVLSESDNPPRQVVLLVQQEVAERVAAQPGSMSILSVTAQYYWQVSLGSRIGRDLFTPPPKVDSQVLILKQRPEPLFAVETKAFFRLVKMGFAQRRKTLLNNLASLFGDRDRAQQCLDQAGLKLTVRAQELSLDDWYKLYQQGTPENT